MKFDSLIIRATVVAVVLMAGACEAPPPYVKIEGEFNRESNTFVNGIEDRSEVMICYTKDGTTARDISALAQRECARFGKIAVFRAQSLQECPLVTPVAAIYNCVENVSQGGFYKSFN